MTRARLLLARPSRQAGFTIVEMMVAVAISFIVILGFAVTFVNIKSTFIGQDKVSQLQDNERLAMSILTSAAQEAGYFPFPTTLDANQIVATTDATYGNMTAGMVVYGTTSSSSPAAPESLSLAFAASANDGLITCQGHTLVASDLTGAPTAGNNSLGVRHIFYVDTANKTLNCIVKVDNSTTNYGGGDAQPLVTNVASMSVLYGITSGTGLTTSVIGYYPASGVTNWSNVKSVRVTLNFVNPNDASATIPWVQTINLLNR